MLRPDIRPDIKSQTYINGSLFLFLHCSVVFRYTCWFSSCLNPRMLIFPAWTARSNAPVDSKRPCTLKNNPGNTASLFCHERWNPETKGLRMNGNFLPVGVIWGEISGQQKQNCRSLGSRGLQELVNWCFGNNTVLWANQPQVQQVPECLSSLGMRNSWFIPLRAAVLRKCCSCNIPAWFTEVLEALNGCSTCVTSKDSLHDILTNPGGDNTHIY